VASGNAYTLDSVAEMRFLCCLVLFTLTRADYIDSVLDIAVKSLTEEVPPVEEYLLHGQCGTPEAPLHRPLHMIQYHLKMIMSDIFEGHCKIEGESFIEHFMSQETECVDLIMQSYCYTQRECDRSMGDGLTFDQLKLAIPDVGEVTKTWCHSHCAQKVLGYVWKCYMDPEIKPFVVEKISEKFDLLKAVAVTYETGLEKTATGRVISNFLKNTAQWNDVGIFIKHNRPAILKLFGDLKFNFLDFCQAECYGSAFHFAENLIIGMAHGHCEHPTEMCGACENNAAEFLSHRDNAGHRVPCCGARLVDWLLARVDAGVAASKGFGNAHLFSDIMVNLYQDQDFKCWRNALEPAVFRPGIVWECTLGKTV